MKSIQLNITTQGKSSFNPQSQNIEMENREVKLLFFYPTTAQEIPLKKWGIYIAKTKAKSKGNPKQPNIPTWVAVQLGIIPQPDAEDEQDVRFTFSGCSEEEQTTCYEHLCDLIATFAEVESDDFARRQAKKSDFPDITASDPFFIQLYLHLIKEVWFEGIQAALLDTCVWKSGQLEGRNTFEVAGRKFHLPAEKVAELMARIGDNYANRLKKDDFPDYNVWAATTAYFFAGLMSSEDKDIKGRVNEAEASAGLLAAVAVEMETLNPPKVLPLGELSVAELESRTIKLQELFLNHLNLEQALFASFFFLHTTSLYAGVTNTPSPRFLKTRASPILTLSVSPVESE